MNVPYLTRRYGGGEPRRLGLAHPSIAPYGVFRLRDGELLIAIQNEREWPVFCAEVLGDGSFASEPRFASNPARIRNREALDSRIQEAVAQMSVAELCAVLDRARIAYGRVSTMEDLMSHPSATTASVQTPEGPVEVLAPPVIVNGARAMLGRVPRLGEHDDMLRHEFGRAAAGRAHASVIGSRI
jgi:crotonobetainyl-CoA:carnitine CoA-transferase CaiB-like acyl-CoA transferase